MTSSYLSDCDQRPEVGHDRPPILAETCSSSLSLSGAVLLALAMPFATALWCLLALPLR